MQVAFTHLVGNIESFKNERILCGHRNDPVEGVGTVKGRARSRDHVHIEHIQF